METRVPLPRGFCPRVSVDGQAEAYLPAVSRGQAVSSHCDLSDNDHPMQMLGNYLNERLLENLLAWVVET